MKKDFSPYLVMALLVVGAFLYYFVGLVDGQRQAQAAPGATGGAVAGAGGVLHLDSAEDTTFFQIDKWFPGVSWEPALRVEMTQRGTVLRVSLRTERLADLAQRAGADRKKFLRLLEAKP